MFEVPLPNVSDTFSSICSLLCWVRREGIHIPIHPLRLLENIQAGMNDELVHVLRRVRETKPGNAIAATFGGAKGDVEERGIGRREDGKIVGHLNALSRELRSRSVFWCILVLVRWLRRCC